MSFPKQSIQELENDYWEDYEFETDLVRRCHEYRKIPIPDLTNEMLRVLIGQEIGLPYLMPVILEKLLINPFMQGELYCCDVLNFVISIDPKYWLHKQEEFKKLEKVMEKLRDDLLENTNLEEIDRKTASEVAARYSNRISAIRGNTDKR